MVVKKKSAEIWWFHLPKYSSFKWLKQRYACWWYIQVPNRIPSCKLLYNGGWSPNSSFALKKTIQQIGSAKMLSSSNIFCRRLTTPKSSKIPASREKRWISRQKMDPSKIEKQFKTRSFEWYSLDGKAMMGTQSHPNHLPALVTIMNFHQSHLSSPMFYPLAIKHGWLENPMFLADFPAMFEILFYHYEIPDQKPMLP